MGGVTPCGRQNYYNQRVGEIRTALYLITKTVTQGVDDKDDESYTTFDPDKVNFTSYILNVALFLPPLLTLILICPGLIFFPLSCSSVVSLYIYIIFFFLPCSDVVTVTHSYRSIGSAAVSERGT